MVLVRIINFQILRVKRLKKFTNKLHQTELQRGSEGVISINQYKLVFTSS